MDEKKNKNAFKKIILIILLITVLCVVGVFLLYKNGLFVDKNNNTNNTTSGKYKMAKLFDYSEKIDNKNSTSIIETEKYYVLNNGEQTILYDKKGNDVTKEVFGDESIASIERLDIPSYDLCIVRFTGGKSGLYDKNFNQIVKIDNQVIEGTNSEDYFIVGDGVENYVNFENLKNFGVYDKSGKLVVPREYERLILSMMYIGNSSYNSYDTDKTLFYAKKNGKYGIIDQNNNIVIPFEYDKVDPWGGGGLGEIFKSKNKYYYILYKNGKYGMVNENNEIIINFEKNNLFYNKYADVVLEKIYDDKFNAIRINVYDLNGILKKEINLSDNFKASFDADYYKIGATNFMLYDNDFIYMLNNNLDYEKYIKPASIKVGHNGTDLFLVSDKIYLKKNNGRYKVYNSFDNSLYMDSEFYFLNENMGIWILFDGFVLCKDKTEDYNYFNCGIINYDGKIIVDFNYILVGSRSLRSNSEYIDFVQDKNTHKISLKKYDIEGKCVTDNKNYYIRDNIIQVGSSIYDLKCNKIADDVNNYFVLNNDLVMILKPKDGVHSTYKIYDMKTGKLAKINNPDNAVITNYIRLNLLDNATNLIVTDKGVYKIIEN